MRKTITTIAIGIVLFGTGSGIANGIELAGTGSGTGTTTTTTTQPRTVRVETVTVWACPSDSDLLSADGTCNDFETFFEQWFEDNGPSVSVTQSHPADSCREDETFAPTHFQDPEGIETDGDPVTRKCQHIDHLFGRDHETFGTGTES